MRGIQTLVFAAIAALGTTALAQDDRPGQGPGHGPGQMRERAPRERPGADRGDRGDHGQAGMSPAEREQIEQLRKQVAQLRQQIGGRADGQRGLGQLNRDDGPGRLRDGPAGDRLRSEFFGRPPQGRPDRPPAFRGFQGRGDRFAPRGERFGQFRDQQGPPRGNFGPGPGQPPPPRGQWRQQGPGAFEFFSRQRDGARRFGGPRPGQVPMGPFHRMMEREGGDRGMHGGSPFGAFRQDGAKPRFRDMSPRQREQMRQRFHEHVQHRKAMKERSQRGDRGSRADRAERRDRRDDSGKSGKGDRRSRVDRPAPRADHER